jgi:hypothetical protein
MPRRWQRVAQSGIVRLEQRSDLPLARGADGLMLCLGGQSDYVGSPSLACTAPALDMACSLRMRTPRRLSPAHAECG